MLLNNSENKSLDENISLDGTMSPQYEHIVAAIIIYRRVRLC